MIAWLLAALASLWAALGGVRLALAHRHWRRALSPEPAVAPPTIVQPILSGDPALARCLSANLVAEPVARFLWLIDDDDPEAARVTRALADGRTTILSGRPPRDGENPKLLKLIRAEARVAGGALVVLDDDTVLRPGGAGRLAAAALAAGGIATAMPVCAPGGTPGERLVAAFVNGQGAATYFAVSALGANRTINGMAYAVAASDLRALGGFAAAGHEVTDDWAVARLWQRAGRPIVQTAEFVTVGVTLGTTAQALRVLRRWMVFALRYARGNPGPTLWALVVLPAVTPLAGLGLALAAGPAAAAGWVALMLGHAFVGAALLRRWAGVPVTASGVVLQAAVDLAMPLLAAAALWRPRSIAWRGRRMDLSGGTIRYR